MLAGPQLSSIVSVMQESRTSSLSPSAGRHTRPAQPLPSGSFSQSTDLETLRHRQEAANGGLGAARLSTAAEVTRQAGDIVQELQGLAVRATDSSLSNADRSALNENFQALSQQLQDLAQHSRFNGQTITNGQEQRVSLGGTQSFRDPDLTGIAAQVQGQSLQSPGSAQDALEASAQAQEALQQQQATLSAQGAAMERATERASIQATNSAQAAGSTLDAALIQRQAEQVAQEIRSSVDAQLVRVHKTEAENVGKLLEG